MRTREQTETPRHGGPGRAAAIAALLGLAVAAPAIGAMSAGPVKGAAYKGTVGPGYPLSFHVSANGKSVEALVAGSESTCVPGPTTAPTYHFPTLAIKQGSFSGTTSEKESKQSDVLEITGRFSGKTATGKLVEKLKIKSLHTCATTLEFAATAK